MNYLFGFIWGLVFIWIAYPDPQAWMFGVISTQLMILSCNISDTLKVMSRNQQTIYDKIK